MKKLLALLLALMMVLSLAACAKDEAPADDAADAPADAPADDAADAPAADDTKDALEDYEWAEWEQPLVEEFEVSGDEDFVIGFTITAFTDKFQMRVLGEAKDYCALAYPNVDFREGDGELDSNIQIGLVENWIAQQVDAVCVDPVDTKACGSICGILKEAGIPLVTPNSMIDCGDPDCNHNFIGSDHLYAGQLEAEYLMEKIPSGDEATKICYLEGTAGYEHSTKRKAGFLNTLDEAGYNYELLSSLEGEYLRDLGLQISEDWFTKYGEEIDAIISANDEMAWGAYEAMKGAGLSGVVICGVDANPDTCQAIADGAELQMSVFQNAEAQGKWGIISAYNACLGKITGDIDVPYERVDATNVADYM